MNFFFFYFFFIIILSIFSFSPIQGEMFQNRAALKLVELDSICQRAFTMPPCWTSASSLLCFNFVDIFFEERGKNWRIEKEREREIKKEEILTNVTERREPLYFADVCAGPGGFSEYMLHKWAWMAKGYFFSLFFSLVLVFCSCLLFLSFVFLSLFVL